MFSVGDRLLTGTSSGCLQLWSVDCSSSPPAVIMETTMEVDGGVFSSAFDSKMELVCVLRGEGGGGVLVIILNKSDSDLLLHYLD